VERNMRLGLSFLVVFVIALSTTISGEESSPEKIKDQEAIQGEWMVTEFTVDGNPVPKDSRQGMLLVFKDDKMSFANPNRKDDRKFEFKLDPSKKPRTIDYKSLDGAFKEKTNFGIYEFVGDELKPCMHNADATDYPKDFIPSKNDRLAIIVSRRAEKAK
jgi:uncharacterized protein (TIGR03067 family)